jgi:uncharacterized membrane protein YdbT with pleckstrin-like domain
MELHDGETILFDGHPSWRATLLYFVWGIGGSLIVGAILWFAVSNFWGVIALLIGVALVVLVGMFVRAATKYTITNERLHIQLGILSRVIHETRLGRVQNVTVRQTPFERLLRVGRVEFDTASEDSSEFVFRGIASPNVVREAVDTAHRIGEHPASSGL